MFPKVMQFLFFIVVSGFGWFPGENLDPTVERDAGLFGNPALLGAYDGGGNLIWYGRDGDIHHLRAAFYGEENGFAFDWWRNEIDNMYRTRWSWTNGAAGFHRRFFLGVRTELMHSSYNSGNAWSWTPGILWRPLSFLAFGYEAPRLWQLGHKQENSHSFGSSMRITDFLTMGISTHTNRAPDLFDRRVHRMLLHGEFKFSGIQVYTQSSLDQNYENQWRVAFALPLGPRAHGSYQKEINNAPWSVGLSLRDAHNPEYISPQRVVRFALDQPLVESEPEFTFFGPQVMTLESLRGQFQLLARDQVANPVVIDFSGYSGGLTAAMEIRRGIQQLRQAGKHVVAYAPEIGPGIFFAASPAHKILLHPQGRARFAGLSTETLYYKRLLQWAGIEANMLRHGEYKSAVEPMTLDSMSTEARADLEALLGSLWGIIRDSVAISRAKTSEYLDSIASIPSLTARSAVEAGLADALVQYDDIAPWVLRNLRKLERPNARMTTWVTRSHGLWRRDWQARARIAVLTIEGTIVDGKSASGGLFGNNTVGSADVLAQLDALEKDTEIDALIVRIESPGGSALASDVIWHRLQKLSQMGLPIVASLGNTAASGGYYVACGASKIVAEPGTVLGSIGIFGGKINAAGLFEKIRVRPEIVKTHASADAYSSTRGFTKEESAALQTYMDEFYENFVKVVAKARHMEIAQADSLAGGRIYTGLQAKSLGLVDAIGGLGEAVRQTRLLAKIPEHIPVELQPLRPDQSWVGTDFMEGMRLQLLRKQLEGIRLWALWPAALGETAWENLL